MTTRDIVRVQSRTLGYGLRFSENGHDLHVCRKSFAWRLCPPLSSSWFRYVDGELKCCTVVQSLGAQPTKFEQGHKLPTQSSIKFHPGRSFPAPTALHLPGSTSSRWLCRRPASYHSKKLLFCFLEALRVQVPILIGVNSTIPLCNNRQHIF
jgi:hypothetical protein